VYVQLLAPPRITFLMHHPPQPHPIALLLHRHPMRKPPQLLRADEVVAHLRAGEGRNVTHNFLLTLFYHEQFLTDYFYLQCVQMILENPLMDVIASLFSVIIGLNLRTFSRRICLAVCLNKSPFLYMSATCPTLFSNASFKLYFSD